MIFCRIIFNNILQKGDGFQKYCFCLFVLAAGQEDQRKTLSHELEAGGSLGSVVWIPQP